MTPGVLAASMDPFGFYRGRLLLKMVCILRFVGQDNILCTKVSFPKFELFKPDFEAILLSVRELPPVSAILKQWAHYVSEIL